LLGAMIISRLQLAAMSRVDIPEDKRRDFFMYVDEFQNFATDSFASILSEARKYRLSLTIAHQYIGQLVSNDGNTKVRDAVFGNVGTIISFRVGAADGEFLEKEFMPEFLQNDLVNLAKANIYIKLMIDGVSSKPFSATTVPPHTEPLVSYKDIIIKNTREHYAVPRKVVEDKIASEWQTNSDSVINEKIGRRDEKPLSQVLRPAGGAAPAQYSSPRPTSPSSTRPRAGAPASTPSGYTSTPGASAPRSSAPRPVPSSPPPTSTTSTASATPTRATERTPAAIQPSSASTPAHSVAVTKEPITPSTSKPKQDEPEEFIGPAAEVSAPAPKQFIRPKVDINELRRSINESLKKQAEASPDETAKVSSAPATAPSAPVVAEPPVDPAEDSSEE
jgi:TraM recognition site of TraD and TraG